ncbi:beta 1-4 rhamnosyltransferase Cps2T [Bacillus rhizoplanae]|uniref:beta 1-4 rhamnosyltransferase Cps2T n=1 Tax=Bacillus rhizoplanae TaxID=2880966 RepID=UPI003D1C63FC
MKNIFIIGSKGIPSKYGGFETFVDKLTEYKKTLNIKYHVACLSDEEGEFEYNGARCFNVKTPNVGAAKAVFYDIKSLDKVYTYIKQNDIKDGIVYILACRIGPFMSFYKRKFEKLGVPIYVNPDGHEWKRAKWNALIRRYWKLSEQLMIKNTDLVICDSVAIEDYIKEEYKNYNPKTTFIAYGATVKTPVQINENKYKDWLGNWGITEKGYYLIVGRFVPENNYELMIREFMKSNTTKSLVIVTNVEKNKFYNELNANTNFENDNRIKFVGTIYDEDLLYQVRTNAFAYLHGHEVGGTNPSLLESLATTSLNLLLNVQFNKEVGGDAALYFGKSQYELAQTIELADKLSFDELKEKETLAKKRIEDKYSWDMIVDKYENTFLGL